MNRDILYFYRLNRAHQLDTYGNSGLHINGVDQRQFTGGPAAYGQHAYAAYMSARAIIHSRKTFANDMKAYRQRSKAAKRGWKTRRTA
jgi:hypothetical protein